MTSCADSLFLKVPNGRSEPDFLCLEMKAYSGDRITLMTPEPDGGMYGERGVKVFVREYGKPTGDDTLYFTGTHRADCRNEKTGLTLAVRGFNPSRKIIEDVGGAVELLNDAGHCAAAWSFAELMIGWNKKHAQARKQKGQHHRCYAADSKLSYGMFSPSCSRFTICRLSLRLWFNTSETRPLEPI